MLAALAVATDFGTDQPPEHALRVCLVAMRLGDELGVAGDDLWHVSLLHAIGCTADSPEAAAVLGDDRALRSAMAAVDVASPPAVLRGLWRASTSATGFARAMARGPGFARDGLLAHCEVGARFAERLGLGATVRDALWHVFERWDGKGFPRNVAGEDIPLAARVLHVARDAVVLERALGPDAARQGRDDDACAQGHQERPPHAEEGRQPRQGPRDRDVLAHGRQAAAHRLPRDTLT